jgi:Family of unknown function (DUF5678)
MTTTPNQISPEIARQILFAAKNYGVSVEDYLETVANESAVNGNGNSAKVKKSGETVDLSDSRDWLKENRQKYVGKWIVLDGKTFIGAGEDPRPIVEKARKDGVKIPFVKFIEDDSEPFVGGWL